MSKKEVKIEEAKGGIRISTTFSVFIPETVKGFEDAIVKIDRQTTLERQRIVEEVGKKFGINVQWE